MEAARGGSLIVSLAGIVLPDSPLAATAGRRRWVAEPGEAIEAFGQRIATLAKALGERLLVIGGLPDDEP